MSRLGTRARALLGLDVMPVESLDLAVGALEMSTSTSEIDGPPIMRAAAVRTAPEGGPARLA